MSNEATDLVGGWEWSPTTKSIGELATQLTKVVEDGSIAVDKQVVRLRAFQQAIETALEQLKPELLDELGKYAKGEKLILTEFAKLRQRITTSGMTITPTFIC